MKTSANGRKLIQQFEGCREKAYQDCVGVWTIGYGHTGNVKVGQVISKEEADRLLSQDLVKFESGVEKNVKVALTQNQFDALVSFCYNLGVGSLQKSTLLKKLNAGDYKGAAEEFLKWNKAGGKVITGLVRRREAEKRLFLTGGTATAVVTAASASSYEEVEVTADVLNVRKGPGTSYEVIDKLRRGTICQLEKADSQQQEWRKLAGREGYICIRYTK